MHFALTASAPGPAGRSCRTAEAGGPPQTAAPAASSAQQSFRILTSSFDIDSHLVDRVPEVTRWVPHRRHRLDAAAVVGGARHEEVGARLRDLELVREGLPGVTFALLAEPCRRPAR